MRFLHLGDLHLGRSLGEFDLYEDQKYILDRILAIADEKRADAVLIAGDVYDRAIPSEAATNLLDYFLDRLAAKKVKVFMISGNHDSDDRLNYGSSLFASNGVYISSRFTGALYRQTVTDEYGEVDVWLLPFVKASQVRHYYPEDKIETYDDAVKTIIQHAGIDSGRRNIIAAHQFVAGREAVPAPGDAEGASPASSGAESASPASGMAEAAAPASGAAFADPKLGGSESPGTRNVGLVEKIGYDCFDGFDYAALGHIHSPQRVGRDAVRYCGSPLKYSLSEANSDKSVPAVTLGPKGDIEIELVPLRPMRDVRHLRGPIGKLLDKTAVTGTEDFIYATLTDEGIIDNAMGIFRQYYPNTVRIEYDNSHTRQIERVDITQIARDRTFEELIRDFYEKMYSCGISEEELQVMKEAAKEAGVSDETD